MSAVRRCTCPIVVPGSIGRGARAIGVMLPWVSVLMDFSLPDRPGAFASQNAPGRPGGAAEVLFEGGISVDASTVNGAAQYRTIETDIPARMDRLPWSKWHWM